MPEREITTAVTAAADVTTAVVTTVVLITAVLITTTATAAATTIIVVVTITVAVIITVAVVITVSAQATDRPDRLLTVPVITDATVLQALRVPWVLSAQPVQPAQQVPQDLPWLLQDLQVPKVP